MRQLPWRTAPRAALSSPLTLVVAAVTALLSCFLGAAAVLHASAAGAATVDYQAEQVCPDAAAPMFSQSRIDPAAVEPTLWTMREQARAHGFAEPRLAVYTAEMRGNEFNGDTYRTRIGYTDGGVDNLELVSGSRAPGLWIGDDLSRNQGIGLGTVGRQVGGGALPPVTGTYTALVPPAPRWWCSQQDLAVQQRIVDPPSGAVLFATDRSSFDQVVAATGTIVDRMIVTFPGPPPRTVDDATDALERSEEMIAAVRSDLDGRGLGSLLNAATPGERSVEIAGQAQANVAFSIAPLAAISVLIGCAGVGTVALQWYQRRYAQLRLLAARGSGPLPLGGLALAELGAPVLAGGIAGTLLARLLLPVYGPPGAVSTPALLLATAVAAAILLVSLALLGAVVALRAHREFQLARVSARRRAWRLLGAFPWELVTGALAVVGWIQLRDFGGGSRSLNPLPQVNPVALTYPVFVVLTVGLLAARAGWLLLRLSHRARFWSRPALQLAIRRLASSRAPVVGVLVIGVLAIGTLAAGNGIATAQNAALETKSSIFVGADSRADTESPVGRGERPLPGPLRDSSTIVGELTGTGSVVLVVDPATFARSARLGALPAEEVEPLLRQIDRPPGETVPAVRVGHREGQSAALPGMPDAAPIADLPVFPIIGTQPGYVISRNALTPDQLGAVPRWSVLSQTPLGTLTSALAAAGLAQPNAVDRVTALDALPFYLVEWTFSFVVVLGAVLAAVAILALLAAVEVRRRQNALAGALVLRMGMRPRALLGSHLIELGTLAGLAVATGVACGLTVAGISVPRFDPASWLAPRSELPDLTPFVSAVAGTGVLVVLAAGWIAMRSVRTARTAELLRA
ncbi:permease [Amycolatopsis antarctica]|uniref:Permease n=1 Tax=Amycolatopsis antarctica TaxID=1854586 RepID=A0A263D3Z8_9PSEU|nr:permease [Amycolatopsis antarctica]OZM72939.1 permease [Amycolatopsis antarctica]